MSPIQRLTACSWPECERPPSGAWCSRCRQRVAALGHSTSVDGIPAPEVLAELPKAWAERTAANAADPNTLGRPIEPSVASAELIRATLSYELAESRKEVASLRAQLDGAIDDEEAANGRNADIAELLGVDDDASVIEAVRKVVSAAEKYAAIDREVIAAGYDLGEVDGPGELPERIALWLQELTRAREQLVSPGATMKLIDDAHEALDEAGIDRGEALPQRVQLLVVARAAARISLERINGAINDIAEALGIPDTDPYADIVLAVQGLVRAHRNRDAQETQGQDLALVRKVVGIQTTALRKVLAGSLCSRDVLVGTTAAIDTIEAVCGVARG